MIKREKTVSFTINSKRYEVLIVLSITFLEKSLANTISYSQVSKTENNGLAKFVLVWNQIINSFRTEDLINNR